MLDAQDIVIGAGMAGLAAAALLARAGRRVLVLEAHDVAGGYAHTFRMRDYRFCAQVHYVFGCGEGETIHRLLSALEIEREVPFVRLDPEGFDHVVVAGARTRIPNGLGKFRDRLIREHPAHARALRGYFDVVATLADELAQLELPRRLSLDALGAAWRARHVGRYLRWTLEDLFDRVGMPLALRAVLAGQCGDYLLPPRDVSLLLHAALVGGYDRGAYYPRNHYFHFVERLVGSITERPGCAVRLSEPVTRIHVEGSRVVGVTTAAGRTWRAERYLSNVDPRATVGLLDPEPAASHGFHGDYTYSSGTFTLYLGVAGLDLRDHGFGSWNVWHYPHSDLNRIYDAQSTRHELDDPWLFLSTPTLHSDAPGLCPPGHQILEVATSCDWGHWSALRRRDRRAYNLAKKRVRERILDRLEASYVPGLRKHLAIQVAGTPVTNERFCRAPQGNSYGAALTPRWVDWRKGPYRSPLDNLWLANATAGFPSVAGAIGAGMKVAAELGA